MRLEIQEILILIVRFPVPTMFALTNRVNFNYFREAVQPHALSHYVCRSHSFNDICDYYLMTMTMIILRGVNSFYPSSFDIKAAANREAIKCYHYHSLRV